MKRAIGLGIVVVMVLVGIVFGVRQTSWWTCHYDTSLSQDDLGYEPADQVDPAALADTGAAEVEELPGVADLLGGMSSDVELTATASSDGTVLSQFPYFAKEDLHRDVSLDPASGEVLWNRGHPGQHQQIGVIDDHQVSVAAVKDGSYRVTALNPETGSVAGCVSVERGGEAGIGKLQHSIGPEGSDLLLTYPAETEDTISLIDLKDHEQRWSTPLDFEAGDLQQVDDVAIAAMFPREEILVDDKIRNHWRDGYQPLLTAFDADSGKSQWQWPASDSDPLIATIVGVVDRDDAAGDASLVVLSVKSLPEDDPDQGEDRLLALDATTGEEVWSDETFPSVDASIVGGQILYASREDYGAVDVATGEPTWQHTEDMEEGDPVALRHATAWTPGTALVTTRAGGLAVLDLETGELTATAEGETVSYFRFYSTDDHLVVYAEDFSGGGHSLIFTRD